MSQTFDMLFFLYIMQNMQSNFLMAMLLTTAAGLATTIGSLISLFYKKPGPIYMSLTLGFSAGVMILISFVEMLAEGIHTLNYTPAMIAFFIGLLIMFIIDVFISHEYIFEDLYKKDEASSLKKTSILVALGIAIHNFPEGMATFSLSMSNLSMGTALAFAIAVHNIPEGIAVAVPVYAATKSSKKAFFWSFLSGLSEPIGALIAGLILYPFLNKTTLAWTLCIVAGFMVYIAFDELLPASKKYGRDHISILGVILGMLIMAISLKLF